MGSALAHPESETRVPSPIPTWISGTIQNNVVTAVSCGGVTIAMSSSAPFVTNGELSLQLDVENIANNIYVIAQEGEFSPAQFSLPRVVSRSAKFTF